MAENKKISEMPFAETLSGSELIPIVQGGGNKAATADVLKGYVQPDLSGYKVKDISGNTLSLTDEQLSVNCSKGRYGTNLNTAKTSGSGSIENYMSAVSSGLACDNRTYVYDGTRDLNPEAINLITEKGLVTVLDGYKVKGIGNTSLLLNEEGNLTVNTDNTARGSNIYSPCPYSSTSIVVFNTINNSKMVPDIRVYAYDGSRDLNLTGHNLVTEKALAKHLAEPNMALFDDMWKVAVGTYGSIDHTHFEEDGTPTPYYLNELWLTYEEAQTVYKYGISTLEVPYGGYRGVGNNLRTLLIWWTTAGGYNISTSNFIGNLPKVETIRFATTLYLKTEYCFAGMESLRKIFGNIYLDSVVGITAFNCPVLEEVQFIRIKNGLNLSRCPLINLASFQYLVTNAANTVAITITVHPDVYAKLTDETNTEWHKVLTDAAAKNISFATTE